MDMELSSGLADSGNEYSNDLEVSEEILIMKEVKEGEEAFMDRNEGDEDVVDKDEGEEEDYNHHNDGNITKDVILQETSRAHIQQQREQAHTHTPIHTSMPPFDAHETPIIHTREDLQPPYTEFHSNTSRDNTHSHRNQHTATYNGNNDTSTNTNTKTTDMPLHEYSPMVQSFFASDKIKLIEQTKALGM